MLMLTEQKLLFSWWPGEGRRQKKRCVSRVALSCGWVVRRTLTWRAATRHLHVELHGVHAQDGVTDVAQHVVAGFHAHESRQLQQLLQLGLPPFKRARRLMWDNWRASSSKLQSFSNKVSPFRVREVNIGPEFNDLSHCFLLWAGREKKSEVNTVNTIKQRTLCTNRV